MIADDLLNSGNFLQTWVRSGGPSNLCQRLDGIEGTLSALTTAITNILTAGIANAESGVQQCTSCINDTYETRLVAVETRIDNLYESQLMSFHVSLTNIESLVGDIAKIAEYVSSQAQKQQQGQQQNQAVSVSVNPTIEVNNDNQQRQLQQQQSANESATDNASQSGAAVQRLSTLLQGQQQQQQQSLYLALGSIEDGSIQLHVLSLGAEDAIPTGVVSGPFTATQLVTQAQSLLAQLGISVSVANNNTAVVPSADVGLSGQGNIASNVQLPQDNQGLCDKATQAALSDIATAIDNSMNDLEWQISSQGQSTIKTFAKSKGLDLDHIEPNLGLFVQVAGHKIPDTSYQQES